MVPKHPLASKEPSFKEAVSHDGHDIDVVSTTVMASGLPWREKVVKRCMCKTCGRMFLFVDFVDDEEKKKEKLQK